MNEEFKEIKKNLKSLFNKIDPEDEFVSNVVNFIDTYDGTNTEEFYLVMMGLSLILMQMNELKVKSDGYEQLLAVVDDINFDINEIAEDYRRVEAGLEAAEPPLSTEVEQ